MEWLLDPHVWASFFTLAVLEIVLGIDNLVFVALLAGDCRRNSRGRPAHKALPWRLRHALPCLVRSPS